MERDRQECTLTGHSDWVTRVQFSDDGAEVISASEDGTVRLSLDVWL
jgi:WD40 repeat protein